ncbi:MAG: DUF4037 domain-containing protein [Eubacteriaceae bacterium]|jgi:hypothetical protein|nr:DUF4037 domain-containing protein [Eubacteriaceae bacterium]
MKGLELAERYFNEAGRPALEKALPDLMPRLAAGLAGEGSECFEFDDEYSRDHDWGPSFCIWLDEDDFQSYGNEVQKIYNGLPKDFLGYPERKDGPNSRGRVGCLSIRSWYLKFTGCPEGPENAVQWMRIPEAFLATASNGRVFYDEYGRFTGIRNRIKDYYPEDVRIKKITARAAVMSQAGQYNYPRCLKRGETVAAYLALAEFIKAAISLTYLLNRKYAPFYKWMYRGMDDFTILPRIKSQILALGSGSSENAQETIEGICINIAAELRRQHLSENSSAFLLDHCGEMTEHISDPQIKQMHIMEG